MLGNAFSGWHVLIILLIVVLLFGATKLPALAKGVGQSLKIFKNEMKTDDDGKNKADDASSETLKQTDSTESKPKS
ncbi:MAG: twin-arginine translocase TatA/TatE family subunit [Lacisediminihabitans sp.]